MSEDKSEREKQDELRGKIIEFETLKEESKQIESQLKSLEARREELDVVSFSMDELKGQSGKEILIPVGSGVFIEGIAKDTAKIFINVGSNIVVPTTLEEAKRIIDEQIEEIDKAKVKLETELKRFIHYMQKIAPEIERLSKE